MAVRERIGDESRDTGIHAARQILIAGLGRSREDESGMVERMAGAQFYGRAERTFFQRRGIRFVYRQPAE